MDPGEVCWGVSVREVLSRYIKASTAIKTAAASRLALTPMWVVARAPTPTPALQAKAE
jgi:hypothetical protein